jgi:hypothetical protein
VIILIDVKTIKQARGADVVAFLEKHSGFTFNRKGGAYRCQQHPSLAVKDNRLSWYWHSKGMGGHGVLDYLTKAENMPFREAVETVTGISAESAQPLMETEKPKTLILPEKSGTALRLYDYLCGKRGIDSGIVDALIQEGKLYEDKRGNVVFVGYDDNGKARFASLRGTYGDCRFRVDCNGSDKRYGFNITSPTSERLYVYESAIDLMSHASLENMATGEMGAWKKHNRISLSGTSDAALDFFLNKQKKVMELVFSLDNDKAGREAAADMAGKYAGRGYGTRVELPSAKDFNNDLIRVINRTRQGQALSRQPPHTDRGG